MSAREHRTKSIKNNTAKVRIENMGFNKNVKISLDMHYPNFSATSIKQAH